MLQRILCICSRTKSTADHEVCQCLYRFISLHRLSFHDEPLRALCSLLALKICPLEDLRLHDAVHLIRRMDAAASASSLFCRIDRPMMDKHNNDYQTARFYSSAGNDTPGECLDLRITAYCYIMERRSAWIRMKTIRQCDCL